MPLQQRAVKAAVGILVVRNGLILLGRRKGSHGAGSWSAPGGRMEYGETIEQAARRELREETALELNAACVGPHTNDVFDDVQEHYLTFIVSARATTGEPRTMEPQKCEGWTWHRWDDLPEPLFLPLANLRKLGFTLAP